MSTPTSSNRGLALVVICLGFFMIMLDTTIVYVATPSILSSLHASLDQLLWVFNAYLLTFAVLLITAGRLGDRSGPRQLFAIGLIVFTAASTLCGLATDANQLIAARVLQGIGGALLTPQTLTMLTALFPAERRGAALGIWAAVVGVATVAGPTLGGYIVTNWDWRLIFFINVPIGLVTLAATFIAVPDVRPGTQHRLEPVGILLSSVALFAIIYGLIEGQRYDWGQVAGVVTIPMILTAGAILLMIFLVWDSRQAEPLVPFQLLKDRNFSLMNWTTAAVQVAMMGVFLPLTLFLQSVLGMSALSAGLTIAPLTVASLVVAPAAGRLTDRLGGKWFLLSGLVLLGGGTALLISATSINATFTTLLPALLVMGVGLGLTFAPMTTMALHGVPEHLAGAASGILNTTRQVGAAIGSAAVGAVLQNQLASTLQAEAVSRASHLPLPYRPGFVAGFANAARDGLQVGRGQTGAVSVPRGLPAQVAAHISQLAHDVFVNAFVSAMRPTLWLPIAVVALAAASCLLIPRRRQLGALEATPQLAVPGGQVA